jgi:hypothetical protein
MLYTQYGVKMYDNGIFAKREQIEKYPDLTKVIVDGAMEGLKFTYLEPEKALDIHVKAVKEFNNDQGRRIIKSGIGIATALGLSSGPKEHGLGWINPSEAAENVRLAHEYMGVEKQIDPESIYTNKFSGTIKLTPDEWVKVENNVKEYVIW